MFKLIGLIVAWSLMILSSSARAETPAARCQPAYYRFADGSGIDIAPVDDTHYRWRRLDGTVGLLSVRSDGKWSSSLGWTGEEDGQVVDLSACDRGDIWVSDAAGHRLDLDVAETQFVSADVRLAGRLILPAGHDIVPIVVLVHGSENSSALRHYALQRLLPAQGVGVFVYDKRGTGQSAGAFTHDLQALAADAQAALTHAKSMAAARAGRIGYYGTSQGGWTAPLAAANGTADFVIVGYGLAVTPMDEDREALALDMTRHGFGAAEVAKALEIGTAAQSIARAQFESGYDALGIVVKKYRNEPWFPFVRGNITGLIINTPENQLRSQGPRLFAGILPDYDPIPVLEKLKTPQLWVLGAADIDAPYKETYDRLIMLKKKGLPISVVVYPEVEHGLYRFVTKGEDRLSTRQPESLQRLLTSFARGRTLDATYDDAIVNR